MVHNFQAAICRDIIIVRMHAIHKKTPQFPCWWINIRSLVYTLFILLIGMVKPLAQYSFFFGWRSACKVTIKYAWVELIFCFVVVDDSHSDAHIHLYDEYSIVVWLYVTTGCADLAIYSLQIIVNKPTERVAFHSFIAQCYAWCVCSPDHTDIQTNVERWREMLCTFFHPRWLCKVNYAIMR